MKKILNFGWIKSFNVTHLYALIGFILIIIISVPLAEKISKRYKINKEIKELEKEISLMESKNNDFTGLISYLDSDQFINEQARIKLNYKQPGEEVVIIKNNDTASSSTDTNKINYLSTNNTKRQIFDNNCIKWFAYFFK